jgi:hypothetical protein
MKNAKLIAIIGLATLMFSACGMRKKDRCPSMGEKTVQLK